MRKIFLRPPGVDKPICVEVEQNNGGGVHCRIGAESASIDYGPTGDGGYVLRVHGRVYPFHSVLKGDVVEIWMGGRTHTLELVDPARRRSGAARGPASGDIVAPMPGTILKILVKPGDRFEAHQPLIIMESMKMEMTLSSPHAGRIKDLLCGVGELTAMGKVLAKLEPAEPDDASK